MIFKFAVFGGLVAFIPGASFILIPLELHIVYKIADKYNSFELFPFIMMSAAIISISFFLKGLASFLHPFPIIGQFANSIVAFGFILILGRLAEKHYSNNK